MTLPDFLARDAYGEILLSGHCISLYGVVRRYSEGHSAEAFARELSSLPMDLIQKVLGFYVANQAKVDAYVEACRQEIDQQAAAAHRGPNHEELQQRWRAKGLGELP